MGNPGNRFFDPFLEMRNDKDCTRGRVLTKVEGENFDHGEVLFRGKVVTATFAHPEIHVGQLVNMIEKPLGVWFATCMQPTWFMAPIDEVIRAGRKAQAALAYLVKDNPRYWPEVIMIDKRGQPKKDDDTDFDDHDTNGDGFIDRDEWPGNPWDFDFTDTDGDGKISREEWDNFTTTGSPVTITRGPISTNWMGYRYRTISVTYPNRFGTVIYDTPITWYPLVLRTSSYANGFVLHQAMTYPVGTQLLSATLWVDGTNTPVWNTGNPVSSYDPYQGIAWLNGWTRFEHQMPLNLCLLYVATTLDANGQPATPDYIHYMHNPVYRIVTIPMTFE